MRNEVVKVIESELLRDLLSQYYDRDIEEAMFIRSSAGLWWIRVMPEHQDFWESFERRFDPGFRVAKKLKAKTRGTAPFGPICPEFPSARNLIAWLCLCTGDRSFLWTLLL